MGATERQPRNNAGEENTPGGAGVAYADDALYHPHYGERHGGFIEILYNVQVMVDRRAHV